MMTKQEKRFINHWLEQKSGPKWKYYVQFSIAWTVVSFLFIFFLTKLFTEAWETGGRSFIYIILLLSIAIGFFSTHFTFVTNEKKYQKILNRTHQNGSS